VAFAGIPRAADKHVELYLRRDEDQIRAGCCDELARGTRHPHRLWVSGREVDGVGVLELAPRKRVVAMGAHALADHRDRALAGRVDVDERAPLRLLAPHGLDPDAELLELTRRT